MDNLLALFLYIDDFAYYFDGTINFVKRCFHLR